MKFSHALVWATVAFGLGADAKLFGNDKRECVVLWWWTDPGDSGGMWIRRGTWGCQP